MTMHKGRAGMLAGLLAMLVLGLTGCGVGPKPRESVAAYDFGLPAAARPVPVKGLAQVLVTAPNWMDTTQLHYRLAYAGGAGGAGNAAVGMANAARPAAYAQTRWVSTPSNLIEARLKERAVAGGVLLGGPGPALRVELDEFSQVFDAEKTSRGVLRARASLATGRDVTAQKAFLIQVQASTPDGPGGALALGEAANRLVDDVLAWAGGAAR